jgi:hypothetical protein
MDFYNDSKNIGDIPGMALSQEEKTAYPILFNKAEPTNGLISANQAFNFLSKSKLPFEILKKIWQLTQTNSTLNREGFFKALKYVALAQSNQPINSNLLYANTPLPNFEGIYLNSRPNASSGQDVSSLAISDIEYEKWSNLFYQSNPVNNNISGNTAKDIFLKSGLSTNTLAEVWQLVDLEKTGELDLNEFLIAMYIIMRIRDNTIREVPRAIPQNLWKSVAYNKKAPNFRAQRLSSISSNNENSFSNNFSSPVSLNRTGGSALPVNINVTGNGSIPMNMTGGSININRTGGSAVSVNKTGGSIIGRNATLMTSGTQGYNNFNSNIGTNQSSNQSLNAGYTNEYAITPQEREKYDQLFNSIDIMGNQYVTGEQSMEFFLKSQLSTQDLAQIWELADISKAGRLTREEFYIAMHLIRQKKSGMKLPLTLPAVLVPPSLRRMSVNSVNSGISASNPQLNQINNTFNSVSKGGSDNNLLTSFDSSSNIIGSNNNNTLGFDSLRSPSNNMENEVNKLKTEIQQMDNSIISMTNEKQLMKGQRDQLEKELTSLVSKKNDLSMKQTQLKISYDSESKMLNDLRATFAKENQAREASQAECNQLEELVKNLKNEKMFIEHDIERCKEEVTQLNNRIKELNTEYSTLKEEVDRLTSEQKHQIDMLNVTRQMTMAEQQKVEQLKQEKMNLQKSIQNNQKEIDRAASERTVPLKQDSKTVNPFEVDGENDFFSNPPSSKSKTKQSFDDAFDALSAHATTFNNDNKFEASFDDAFSAPNTAGVQPTSGFDDAFQVQSAKSAQPTSNSNIFDDAFQVNNGDNGNNANTKEPEDPFEKHAQSIPNVFEDSFEKNASSFDDAFSNSKITTEEKQKAFANSFQTNKNNSVLEDPFASNVNLSTVGTTTSGFDDAFVVPNNDKQPTPNANINSFDDAFGRNTNSPFTNANGFDDAFQINNNNNVNNQAGQTDFGADFNSAFDNSNNNNDPFKVSENPATASIKSPNPVSTNEKQDLAGFAFNQPGFTNQDKAGFSFDNAFDAAAAAATTNVIQSNNGLQVASPEIAEAPIKSNTDEENDSSIGEEDENVDDNDSDDDDDDDDDEEEAENPFGDDQVIEDGFEEEVSQTYPMPQPVQNSEVKPVNTLNNNYEPQENIVPGTPEVPMPQLVPESLQFSQKPVIPEQQIPEQEEQQPAEIDQSSYPMPQPVQDQQPSVPVSAVEPPQEQQPSVPVSAVEPSQEQDQQQQPTAPVVEPQQEQQQQPSVPVSAVEPSQEQQQSSVPVSAVEPSQEQIKSSQPQEPQQDQQQEQDTPVNSENPFESQGNAFANENAFETDLNSAFKNMSISKENQTPGNDTNNETNGNMVKSFSNNSIKIDNFDFDKEFQEFDNNPSGFDKVDTNKNSTSAQNTTNEVFDENGVNNSFDEEFKPGFDENDFNFDTTFNGNASKENTNNSNAFDAFAEQATASAQFETTFDDGFNNNFNEPANTTAPNFETKFDDAFNSSFNNNQSNVTTAHFDTNFDDAFNFDSFSNANNNTEQKPSDAFMDEAFGGSTPALTSGDNTNAFDDSAFDNNFNDLNGGDPFAAFSSTTPTTNAPITPATNTEPTNDNTNNANNDNING